MHTQPHEIPTCFVNDKNPCDTHKCNIMYDRGHLLPITHSLTSPLIMYSKFVWSNAKVGQEMSDDVLAIITCDVSMYACVEARLSHVIITCIIGWC